MWTPLDLDPLYTPLTKLILFSFSSIMWDSELKDCKGNLIMFFEYFQVIQLIPCEPIRLTGIKYPNNNCLKNCLIILLRTLVRAPPLPSVFFSSLVLTFTSNFPVCTLLSASVFVSYPFLKPLVN